jgi:hypothetical protein
MVWLRSEIDHHRQVRVHSRGVCISAQRGTSCIGGSDGWRFVDG